MPMLFGRDVFMYDDFGYYVSGDFGTGRNIGYRWLLWLFDIKSLNTLLPICLAFIINVTVDIAWIYLLSKHLNLRGLFIFVLMLGLQPYSAVYTIKFSPIIFAKIGLLFFCNELFRSGFDRIKQKTLSLGEFVLWTMLCLIRNSNLFIATPYIFLKLRNKPLIAVLLSVSFALVIIYSAWYDGLLPGVDASNWPWSLSYIKQLLDIENNFVAVVVTFISRVILLFGAREKLHNIGIEPFLVWGIPAIELCIYFLLACAQFIGFCFAIHFIFKKYGYETFAMLILIGFSIVTVSHQRYLIPFIPLCLFGLALIFDGKSTKQLK